MEFESKVTPERLAEIRKRCLQLTGISHENRAIQIAPEFPDMKVATLKDYSCICLGSSEKVWALFEQGKLRISILRILYSLEPDEQDFVVDHCVEKQLDPSVVLRIRKFVKEGKLKLVECVERAIEEAKAARSEAMAEFQRSKRRGATVTSEAKNDENDKGDGSTVTAETTMMSETKLTREIAADIRKKAREMHGKPHETRALLLHKDYPNFSVRTLEGYSRVSNNCSEKVWNFLAEGKVALTTVEEMCDWQLADQNKIIDEAVARNVKLTVRQIRVFKKGGTLSGIEEAFTVPDPPPAPEKPATEESRPQPEQAAPSTEDPEERTADLLPGESRLTREDILELRRIFREMPDDMTTDARAAEVMKNYPNVSQRTLLDYCGISLQCTEKVWNLYISGKAKLGMLKEIYSMEPGDQDFFIEECIAKNLGPSVIRKIRRFRKEEGWGFPECIAKATGEVPANQPRRDTSARRGLDGLLTDIADKGARWRAMVQQAITLVGKEEAEAGVHEAIFTKVFLLRELIGEQYNFVNSRLQRYMNLLRKQYRPAASTAPTEMDVDAKIAEPADPIDEPLETPEVVIPDLTPIPEGERQDFKDRAGRHDKSNGHGDTVKAEE